MKKQTAVEWLVKQLLANGDIRWRGTAIHDLAEQAKAMEKEQIIKAFCEGYDHDGDNYDGAEISYYNRTYRGGEQ
jgi:predicted secreted protein